MWAFTVLSCGDLLRSTWNARSSPSPRPLSPRAAKRTGKHAKREGVLDGVNPMQDVSVKGVRTKPRMEVCSLDEILTMLKAAKPFDNFLPIALVAFTGLRQSELRGLRWGDFYDGRLHVQRAVWRTEVSGTRTVESEAPVPVVPIIAGF